MKFSVVIAGLLLSAPLLAEEIVTPVQPVANEQAITTEDKVMPRPDTVPVVQPVTVKASPEVVPAQGAAPVVADQPGVDTVLPSHEATPAQIAEAAAAPSMTAKAPNSSRSHDGDFSQFFTIEGGAFSPQSVVITNGDYTFNYGAPDVQSFTASAGWAVRLFKLLGGAFHLEEHLSFTSLSGQAPTNIRGVNETQDLSLYLIGVDLGMMYSMEWFPWKRLIPFADGGYRYTFYSQSGPSDLESVQGGVGNFEAGGGLRFWLNRGHFTSGQFGLDFTSIPVFLTAKYSHIFSDGQLLDLASDSFLGGIAIGL